MGSASSSCVDQMGEWQAPLNVSQHQLNHKMVPNKSLWNRSHLFTINTPISLRAPLMCDVQTKSWSSPSTPRSSPQQTGFLWKIKQCLPLYSQPQAVLKPFIYKTCSQISQCTIFLLRISWVNCSSLGFVCLQVLLHSY